MVTLMFWAGDEAICFYNNENGMPQSQKDFKTEDDAFEYASAILNKVYQKYPYLTEITIHNHDSGEMCSWGIFEDDTDYE